MRVVADDVLLVFSNGLHSLAVVLDVFNDVVGVVDVAAYLAQPHAVEICQGLFLVLNHVGEVAMTDVVHVHN